MKKNMAIGLMAVCLTAAWPAAAWAEPETASGTETVGASQAEEQKSGWIYQAEDNTWRYYGWNGEAVTGRRQIDGDTYFFDEEGVMLTGWVTSGDHVGDDAYTCTSGGMDDSVFYCDTTGRMAHNQWMPAYAPDSLYFEEDGFSGPSEEDDEDGVNWYYFDAGGHVYRDERLEYQGDSFVFDEDGKRLTGWVYEDRRSGSLKYVKVEDTTQDAWSGDLHGDGTYAENDYAHNPQNYLFCDWGSGKVVKNTWITANPPGKDDDEDDRSYYCSKSGHIVTQYKSGFWRESGDWDTHGEAMNENIVADKIWPRKLENRNIGTYAYNGTWPSDEDADGYEGFIFQAADGRYYLCENNGARLDGLFLICKKDTSTKRSFPNGFYDFSDHAAMVTGPRLKTSEDGNESFFYYFAERTSGDNYKGRGVTGVYGGKLYYQGLAVGSDSTERYQLIYIPEIANRDSAATGLFLVDAEGNVKTGSASHINKKGIESGGKIYHDYGSFSYRVCKPSRGDGKNGYDIYYIDKDQFDEDDPLNDYHKRGERLGEDDAVCIYMKEAEE